MMTRRTLLALAAAALTSTALLSACAPKTPPAPIPPPEGAYLAIGTEPFWSLEITPSELRYVPLDGARTVVKNPGGRPSFNGMRYVTERLSVDVTYAPCSDGMSDRRYADTVSVAIGEQTLRGCGGTVLPPADLAGTSWRLLNLSGADAAPGDRPATIAFAKGTLSGSSGCNSFSASANIADDRLTSGPLRTTRMACDGALAAQEAALTKLLAAPVAIRFTRDGKLLLSSTNGATAVLEWIE